MRVCLITIFPGLIRAFLEYGLIKRAVENGQLAIHVVDLRDHAHDKHRQVDDTPFGGGGGMVLRPEPLFEAVEMHRQEGDRVILLSPQGRPLSHAKAAELASLPGLQLLCGRYEGVDERVRQSLVDEEISIGDYVLMGGELPALVLLETVARLMPGVLGNQASPEQDSFAQGLLDFPQYTRPAEFRGVRVPDVLLSGNHAAVVRWRKREALRQTLLKRPELILQTQLSEEDRALVETLKRELTSLVAG